MEVSAIGKIELDVLVPMKTVITLPKTTGNVGEMLFSSLVA